MTKRNYRLLTLLCALLFCCNMTSTAQHSARSKISPFVRTLAERENTSAKKIKALSANDDILVLARMNGTEESAEEVLSRHKAASLTSFGDIHIVRVPLHQIASLSDEDAVERIEASPIREATLDTVAYCIDAWPAYEGRDLDMPYKGKGVVVGLQDLGYDLEHPNFYTADMKTYRIKALWDMLSRDTISRPDYLFTGQEYTTKETILELAHSYDGIKYSHGTHTTGTAAGSGYDTKYMGLAPESDICLVGTVTSNNISMLDNARRSLFSTSAYYLLGFKYIFDYAGKAGMPCVINYSIGGAEDYYEDTRLEYEILDSLTGPGRIIVASAGNTGHLINYVHKPAGTASAGTTINNSSTSFICTLKSDWKDFDIRIVTYAASNDTMIIHSKDVPLCTETDSSYTDSKIMSGRNVKVTVYSYPSYLNPEELAFEVLIQNDKLVGLDGVHFTIEVMGEEADVEIHRYLGNMYTSQTVPHLNDGDNSYGVNAPGAAASLISVGATSYRNGFLNYYGEWNSDFLLGDQGLRANTSAVGPSFSGRIKPDVVAPGMNIRSSGSSYYYLDGMDDNDKRGMVAISEYNGYEYPWYCLSGTSMASPVVTGAVALWLEANPKLTPEDIITIFSKTCTHPDPMLEYPNNQYGYGQIDVYEGLKEALRMASAGINEIETDKTADNNDGWYNLQGEKVNRQDAKRGIFINSKTKKKYIL